MANSLLPHADQDPLDQAIAWHIELDDEACSAATRAAWQDWYQQDPRHRQAWQNLQRLDQQFGAIDPSLNAAVSRKVLVSTEHKRLQRRTLLRSMVGLGITLPLGWGLFSSRPLRNRRADFSSAVGQRRQIQLQDGSRILLNTDSHINLRQRPGKSTLELVSGELYLERSATPSPLLLSTDNGFISAAGRRLQIRHTGQDTRVTALQGTLSFRPAQGLVTALQSGEFALFDQQSVQHRGIASAADSAWQRGMLLVEDWPLAQFCNELERYIDGAIFCTAAVSGLRLSGSFPVQQPRQLLPRLEQVLPVRITRISPYLTLVSQS